MFELHCGYGSTPGLNYMKSQKTDNRLNSNFNILFKTTILFETIIVRVLKVIVLSLAFVRFEVGFFRKRSQTIFFQLFPISIETSGLNHRVSISNAFRYPSRIFASDFSGLTSITLTIFGLSSECDWTFVLSLVMIFSNSFLL